ncbi:NADPH-dependent FMN reductase [Actinomadura decatromicini]|uniref:NAD(P)H-dependent oxidoreductase n=1 Tax=Actinomadura decatromicini TaxID=2604572 RepID=A0A5D3FTN1_9ACTN|nr:NAD(P)H-dependent oxidoreductase [Actinomadura decatromicini]TYK51429.1 NAD(P)H-dependent oxidoreductase [Actinomadura decatromicini]
MNVAPEIIFLSGSLSEDSKTRLIADWCAALCVERGALTQVFRGADLEFPFYRPGTKARDRPEIKNYLRAMEKADAVVLVSPAYHGGVSGLLKNAIDYLNELGEASRPLLDGRAIGCVAVARGEQGAASTLAMLRTIGHALRGWPTPLGVALSNEQAQTDSGGVPRVERTRAQLKVMLGQVISHSRISARRKASRTPAGTRQ